MKKLLTCAALAFALLLMATPKVKADDPVQMTYAQAEQALEDYVGVTPEQAAYILTHSETYYGLLLEIALIEGLLPYHP